MSIPAWTVPPIFRKYPFGQREECGLLGVGDNVLASIMGHIGNGGAFVSANSITNVVSRVSTIFITGLAYAGCFIIGQTLGNRDVEGAKRQGNTFLALGLSIGLLAADMSTMWLISIPLGALAGLVLDIPPFWVFICLHADQIVKAVWCVFRLKSGKWIKKIKGVEL